ncbi:hypothetical protein EDB86DRAFT_3103560 [Lactarius hatsudake]|nr:hypothetical protein EDB86DRAFT_3103560 [Lactarius hatsudake]
MEWHPYLSGEDQDGLLPPSSPPIIQPLSPLTVLDRSEDDPPTVHASSGSPLSSPLESPTPAPHSLVFSLAPGLVLNNRRLEAGSSEDSFIPSSPIRSRDDMRRKAQKKRDEERDARAKQAREQEQQSRTIAFKECLDILSANELTFAELTEYVFFHENQTPDWRYENFFINRGLVTRLLDFFVSSKVNKTCREDVRDWAESVVLQTIKKEVNAVTQSGDLRITEREIDSSFASGLSFDELKAIGERHHHGSTSKKHIEGAVDCQEHAAAFVVLNLLGARSQKNSYARHVMGLYLYSMGATRQQISVMNHLGLSVSYVTLAGRGNKAGNLLTSKLALASSNTSMHTGHKHRLGTLEALSESMRKVTRKVAASDLYVLVYDNINMLWKVAEQILGRTDSIENGTCATIVSLFQANVEDLKAIELERRFSSAPELKVSDITLSEDEYALHRKCLVHTILWIAVQYGGPGLQVFRKDLQTTEPHSKFRIEVHKSKIHPLPAMNINEASTMGNAEVIDAVMEELNIDTSKPEFCETLRPVAGDQLSIARLRAVLAARAGNEGGASSLRWALFIPGLFHCKIAATNGFLHTHFGHPNHDLKNPASLASHNTLLQRKPIVLSSLPPFRTCRDLIFVSLYARVLHCLLKVSGAQSLESFSDRLTWSMLCGHAEVVVDAFTDGRVVDSLRCSRRQEDEAQKESCGERERGTVGGDMIFENAVLFLHDGLILREFSDAIKSGDSGRVLLVLKLWALSFQGSGRSKYAYEVLHLLHNVTHVWPEPVVRIVLNNWLVNPTGKANSFVELDLMQEHLNYWIKVRGCRARPSHGSGASWEWLATISPCIEVLRRLATEVNGALGSKQGNRHASADLTKDIKILMGSLEQNNVYERVIGRTLGDGDNESPAPDVIGEGYTALTWGAKSPLRHFNLMISTLQRRCSIPPLVGTTLLTRSQETFSEIPPSEDDGPALALNGPEVPDSNLDNEELELDEELEHSCNATTGALELKSPRLQLVTGVRVVLLCGDVRGDRRRGAGAGVSTQEHKTPPLPTVPTHLVHGTLDLLMRSIVLQALPAPPWARIRVHVRGSHGGKATDEAVIELMSSTPAPLARLSSLPLWTLCHEVLR